MNENYLVEEDQTCIKPSEPPVFYDLDFPYEKDTCVTMGLKHLVPGCSIGKGFALGGKGKRNFTDSMTEK